MLDRDDTVLKKLGIEPTSLTSPSRRSPFLGVFFCPMITNNHHRLSSFSTEVNTVDHNNHEHLSANPQASSSSSSLSCPLGFIPDKDHGGSSHRELKNYEEPGKNVSPCGSCDHEIENKERKTGLKLTIKKRDYKSENQTDNGSSKWMPSKMRMMQKMIHTDQTVADIPQSSVMKFKDQKQQSSSVETDDNSSNNFSNNGNITVRVCADCHTTKTPLWRSGPRGPKSLCNACGIRQRKARRAMAAAAASANGSIVMTETSRAKGKMLHKEKKSKNSCAPQSKKRCKLETTPPRGRKKFCFEEFTMNLSNNLTFQQVFPQDEKEAAILLMSLSYGLVHG